LAYSPSLKSTDFDLFKANDKVYQIVFKSFFFVKFEIYNKVINQFIKCHIKNFLLNFKRFLQSISKIQSLKLVYLNKIYTYFRYISF